MRTLSYVALVAAIATPALGLADQDKRAAQLARKYPLVDTHIDVPYRMHDGWRDISVATPDRDFDYPRAKQGGLDVLFMSIYAPAESEAVGEAYDLANNLIDQVEAMVYRDPDKFAMAYSVKQARANFGAGKVSFALGMENGAPVAGSLENLRHFYQRGIRYITLTHALANHISDSSYDEVRYWNGLSPFGFEVVEAMNKLGMIVDVSHLSDEAFADVIKSSRAPVVATHSSARKFTPEFERNMNDDMIKALAENGGLIMINFGSGFVTEKANKYDAVYFEAYASYAERNQLAESSPEMQAFEKTYREKQPYPFSNVADVADHIDHVKALVGIDHVGLGSDYDGVGDSLPIGLKDVSQYPNLVAELLRRDYSEKDIEKLLGDNILRVWREVELIAR